MLKFRTLKADEIDIKVGNVTSKGYSLLLYKNARTDMDLLDETVGAENWQNKFYEVCCNLYCSLGIKIDDEWIWKDDCGVESAFGDKEKGQASDARKRAGFAWGIGRELYTSPFIFIPCQTTLEGKVYKITDNEEKYRKFKVQSISYNDSREIEDLVIVDQNGTIAFSTKHKPVEKQNYGVTPEKEEIKCVKCGMVITEKVAKYSKSKYGKELCFNCQKDEPETVYYQEV